MEDFLESRWYFYFSYPMEACSRGVSVQRTTSKIWGLVFKGSPSICRHMAKCSRNILYRKSTYGWEQNELQWFLWLPVPLTKSLNGKTRYDFWLLSGHRTGHQHRQSVDVYFSKFFQRAVQLFIYGADCNATCRKAKLPLGVQPNSEKLRGEKGVFTQHKIKI